MQQDDELVFNGVFFSLFILRHVCLTFQVVHSNDLASLLSFVCKRV